MLQLQAEGSFDFSLNSMDMFKFQEKDFKEEQKKVKQMLLDQQAELVKNSSTMCQTRHKRAAALQAMEDVHNYHKPKKPTL